LDVEVTHVQHAASGFADDGKRFREKIGERFAFGEAFSCFSADSKALTCATIGRNFFSSRSFCVPTTFARRVPSIGMDLNEDIQTILADGGLNRNLQA
jgi:hypothetical protein